MGEDKVKPLFPIDHTHNSPEGGDINAELIVGGLNALQHCPFTQYFSTKGNSVPAYPTPGTINPTKRIVHTLKR